MKITKEEKSLYNFLKIVASIFSKSDSRNLVFGNGPRLVFKSWGYLGMFENKGSDDQLFDDYNFENHYYELKQLPNGNYVLDPYSSEDVITQEERMSILASILQYQECKQFAVDLQKDDDHKLAKITSTTNRWIRDDELKYIKSFPEVEVFRDDDHLIFKSFGLTEGDVSKVTTLLAIQTEETDKQHVEQKIMFEGSVPKEEPNIEVEEELLDDLIEEIHQEETAVNEVEEDDPMQS